MRTGRPDVVFDCVVFAQALISPFGPSRRCVEKARDGEVRLFVSEYVLNEIRELPYKIRPGLGVTAESAEALAKEVGRYAVRVNEVPSVYVHPHDPDDSHYVDLAVATGAELVVSRDRHLLNLMKIDRADGREFRTRFPAITVITPDELLNQLRTSEPPNEA